MSERTKKYPVPLNVKTRAKIRRNNRLWKKYLLTRGVQAYQEYCILRNRVRRLTRKAHKIYEKSIISQIKENPKKEMLAIRLGKNEDKNEYTQLNEK